MIKVSPSILTADFAYLGDAVKRLDDAGADWIHLDVMDNVFVPNMSFGQTMISSLRRLTEKPFDVHLMMVDSAQYIGEFIDSGADIVTIHPESPSSIHLQRVISTIKQYGKKAGIALNPSTHPDVLEYIYDDIDLVLVMSVNPGYGGQKFLTQSLRKIEYISNRIRKLGLSIEVEVDGGITVDNARQIRNAGATVIVAGSAVVDSDNWADSIRKIKGLL